MSKIKKCIFILSFLLTLYSAQSCYAQPSSLIETLLLVRESIVSIEAIQTFQLTTANNKLQTDRSGIFFQNGAGVIVNSEGLIVTNLHTIYGADYIKVTFSDGTAASGQIEKLLPESDIALIKVITAKFLKPIVFDDSDSITLGEEIINIGHSDLLNGTLSAGNIIGIGRLPNNINNDQSIQVIKININLHKGDSGGPILTRSGKFLGMIYAQINSPERPSIAIPSNKIKKLYTEYLKKKL